VALLTARVDVAPVEGESRSELRTGRGGRVAVPDARLGPDRFLDTGLPFVQPQVPGARPRTNVLVSAVPSKELGDLVLTLNAERVGERGEFRFAVPRPAFAP
jgi:hypothetical protein